MTTDAVRKRELREAADLEVYKTEISPLIDKLYELCKKHNVPFVMACQPSAITADVFTSGAALGGERVSPRIQAMGVFAQADQDRCMRLVHAIGMALELERAMEKADHEN